MSFWTRLFKGAAAEEYERGILLFNEGRYDEAAKLLEEVMAESKSRGSPLAKLGAFYAAEAHAKIGIALFYQGKLDSAFAHFQTALRENPHFPDLYYYLGVVYHQNSQYENAIAALEKAVALNPEYAEAVCYLGIALHDAGFFERGQEEFGRALAIARRNPNPLSRILVDKLDTREFDVPILGELKQLVLDNAEFENHVREGTGMYNRGDYSGAVREFEEAVAQKPMYADLHCKLGMSLIEDRRAQEAVDSLRRAVELNPGYVDGLYYLGVALFLEGDYTGSKEQLQKALLDGSRFADLHCQYGIVLITLGEFEEAREVLQTALKLSPSYAKAMYLLGLTEHALGEFEKASVTLRQSLAAKPDLFTAEMDTGLEAAQRGDWFEAKTRFERFVEAVPGGERRADAMCLLGSACLELRNLEDARRYLDEAFALSPDNTEVRRKLALVNYVEKRYDEAEKLVREGIELHQDYPDLHKILGDIMMQKGEFRAAREAYDAGTALNPNYADCVFGTVIALRREGRGREGDEILEAFIERNPQNLMARTLLTAQKMQLPDE